MGADGYHVIVPGSFSVGLPSLGPAGPAGDNGVAVAAERPLAHTMLTPELGGLV